MTDATKEGDEVGFFRPRKDVGFALITGVGLLEPEEVGARQWKKSAG